MPVAQLLCEGGNNSPDVRLLSKLLAGFCEVKPQGAKYGMGERIKVRRDALRNDNIYGILDGDFITDWVSPTGTVVDWTSKDQSTHFGWRWERKEIENYLIDPAIVEKALGNSAPDMEMFSNALKAARDQISVYQAARLALAASRVPIKNIPSAFGLKRGREKHFFPENFDKESCLTQINLLMEQYQETQQVKKQSVVEAFMKYLPECETGGCRNLHFLHAFAGKDLFWAMDKWLSDNGFQGAGAFRERVLMGMQNAMDDIAEWLQEWSDLRRRIE